MDKATKRRQSERIKREFTRALAACGFRRTKTTFWTRANEHVIEFIRLHQFTFAPSFRIHLGIRVLNSTFEGAALNGLSSYDGWYGQNREYSFEFDETAESVQRCAGDLARFCANVAAPWFHRFNDPQALLNAPDSPLKSVDDMTRLRLALEGKSEDVCVRASRVLLGVAEQMGHGQKRKVVYSP